VEILRRLSLGFGHILSIFSLPGRVAAIRLEAADRLCNRHCPTAGLALQLLRLSTVQRLQSHGQLQQTSALDGKAVAADPFKRIAVPRLRYAAFRCPDDRTLAAK
jgi:hypothetical protein